MNRSGIFRKPPKGENSLAENWNVTPLQHRDGTEQDQTSCTAMASGGQLYVSRVKES